MVACFLLIPIDMLAGWWTSDCEHAGGETEDFLMNVR